jgi:CRISPR-associated protein (TIGR03986 family)
MIHAPFNFVPLTEKVFFPDWADQISHDIPFEDGTSGILQLKITAQTPVFVRNGHTKQDADAKNETYTSFSKTDDGKYFIPASSLKGSIRNVLEILSFSKMSKVDKKRYSIRDLYYPKYMKKLTQDNVRCGWLYIDEKNNQIIITDHGIPFRVSHQQIDQYCKTNFCDIFSRVLKDEEKTAIFKYQKLGKVRLNDYKFHQLPPNPKNPKDTRKIVKFSDTGELTGTIVLTGQASPRTENNLRAKFFEFVFPTEEVANYTFNIDDDLYKDFCFIYSESEDWKYWKNKALNGAKVPIFFVKEKDTVAHMGLSYLYKLPYPKRMNEYVYDEHKKKEYDLAECVFGFTEDKESLKGRVAFGNAFAINAKELDILSPYCGSPKPTYYPIYLSQKGTKGYLESEKREYKTMLDSGAILKGWKRYPVKSIGEVQTRFDGIPENQIQNTNPFIPLCAGTEFIASIYYHNLKKEELGALLSALELKGNRSHSIGFGKAFGYGAIKIELVGLNESDRMYLDECKECFNNIIKKEIADENIIKKVYAELNALTMVQSNLDRPQSYMDVEDYVASKGNKKREAEYLPYYSEMIVRTQAPTPVKEVKSARAKVMATAIRPMQASLVDSSTKYPLVGDDRALKKLKIGKEIDVDIIYSNSGKIKELKLKS